ncbi:FAD-dependent monooxygenase [Paraglaciecola aestuariivivens]
MYDFCVVGGGMIGSATALGLSHLGFKVALLEAKLPKPFEVEQAPDIRVSAINLNTEQLLHKLGAWQSIQAMRVCPYTRLSVWDNPSCRTDFCSKTINQSHLGHIIENRVIQLGLHQTIQTADNVTLIGDLSIDSLQLGEVNKVSLTDGSQIAAKMLIAADGGQSFVRQQAGIGVQGWQYSQQALGILIKTCAAQQDITWQQFTANGPLAFLPLFDGYASLVWYHHPQDIRQLQQLSKTKLKQQIQAHFPPELMDFEVLSSASFPLTRMHANQYYKANTLLIGDAAHTINPLAGQGVNLGFKDVTVLLEVLAEAKKQANFADLLSPDINQKWLKRYQKQRRADNLLMMSAMDILYAGFSNNHFPFKFMRNAALKLANNAGPLKAKAMRYAIGL